MKCGTCLFFVGFLYTDPPVTTILNWIKAKIKTKIIYTSCAAITSSIKLDDFFKNVHLHKNSIERVFPWISMHLVKFYEGFCINVNSFIDSHSLHGSLNAINFLLTHPWIIHPWKSFFFFFKNPPQNSMFSRELGRCLIFMLSNSL